MLNSEAVRGWRPHSGARDKNRFPQGLPDTNRRDAQTAKAPVFPSFNVRAEALTP